MATSEHEQETGAVACSSKQTQLGEGVRWDARRGEMLGVDILAGRVARARIADDGSLAYVREYQLPWTVGMIAPVEGDGGWVLGPPRITRQPALRIAWSAAASSAWRSTRSYQCTVMARCDRPACCQRQARA